MKNPISEHSIEFFELKEIPDFNEFNYQKIPLEQIAAFGLALNPMIKQPGDSGLYYVNVPKGALMHKKASSGKYMSNSYVNGSKGTLAGHAELTKVPFDPLTLVVALSLNHLDNRFTEIVSLQEDILNYLVEKDMAEQRGNLLTLIDIHDEYKEFWNNEIYRQNKHILVQDIKRTAKQSIQQQERAINKSNRVSSRTFMSNNIINKNIEKLNIIFKEYNLANYIYAFASYLEVILLGDFSENVLNKATKTISDHAFKYRQFYTETYTMLEKQKDKSLEKTIFSGFTEVNLFLDELNKKAPFAKKNKAKQENKFENYLEDNLVNKLEKELNSFTENKTVAINHFVTNLNELQMMINQEQTMYIDKDNVYFKMIR